MMYKLLSCLVLLAGLAGPAFGEHEVYYRYTVLGYLKDARGGPLSGVTVSLTREKTGFRYLGETDAAGLYLIVARLGDESAGERLRLDAGEHRVSLVVSFDPRNHTEERGTRLDFVGGHSVERASWFLATLRRVVGGE
ncbi:MAG TPA: carboxypeptidase-like regulatory domain-containing protein [Methylomirabilota bacterium]|nr:carboxypeptidase-like regulatory domain-containing protein [Methylomirabilota bacterium]